MALVTFRSRAASAILMVDDSAYRLLELIGKPAAERGVITAAQLDAALEQLTRAVEQESAAGGAIAPDDTPPALQPVSLRQRAFPLLEMLRAARRRNVDVTWGI